MFVHISSRVTWYSFAIDYYKPPASSTSQSEIRDDDDDDDYALLNQQTTRQRPVSNSLIHPHSLGSFHIHTHLKIHACESASFTHIQTTARWEFTPSMPILPPTIIVQDKCSQVHKWKDTTYNLIVDSR